jgi:hypothetical protein
MARLYIGLRALQAILSPSVLIFECVNFELLKTLPVTLAPQLPQK